MALVRLTQQNQLAALQAQEIRMNDATLTLILEDAGAAAAAQQIVYGNILRVDPESAGAEEILALPPESNDGLFFFIQNTGDESVRVTNDDGTTATTPPLTVGPFQSAIVFCSNGVWYSFGAVGDGDQSAIQTIAASGTVGTNTATLRRSKVVRVDCGGASRASLVMPAGAYIGHEVNVANVSDGAETMTFAALATSRVFGGTAVVIDRHEVCPMIWLVGQDADTTAGAWFAKGQAAFA